MEDDKNKNYQIAQHYKMRFYENEFPEEGELVLVILPSIRDNQKNQKKTDVMSHSSSTITRSE
jgi:hypothetical protein